MKAGNRATFRVGEHDDDKLYVHNDKIVTLEEPSSRRKYAVVAGTIMGQQPVWSWWVRSDDAYFEAYEDELTLVEGE